MEKLLGKAVVQGPGAGFPDRSGGFIKKWKPVSHLMNSKASAFHNRTGPHSGLDYLSPINFKSKLNQITLPHCPENVRRKTGQTPGHALRPVNPITYALQSLISPSDCIQERVFTGEIAHVS
jgi:hypothetical protein